MQRVDDLKTRRRHLEGLSDEELKERFWRLARDIVMPLYQLAYTHTSPSIERAVLLRMGFSSLEAMSIVSWAVKTGLLGKGAGQLVLEYAKIAKTSYLEAGRALSAGIGWDEVKARFGSDER
ncbi:MAG: ornithine aminomutase subunit alpha [Bacillota bacterium]|jgi:D-ornithine 4,5-aminomutase subunit alpha